jgi:hypothetical protein
VQCINEQELLEHAKLTVSVGRQETLARWKNSPAESLEPIPLPTLWTLKSATATRRGCVKTLTRFFKMEGEDWSRDEA